jgi:lipoprotein-anchoring transpeptidase ErfK/SrfK
VGVGKAGLAWNGTAEIKRKAEWPRWTPTADMIRREPERNGPWRNGMAPGLTNPLGPRALYLFDGDRDTPLPHSRHDRAANHRHERLVRLHPDV